MPNPRCVIYARVSTDRQKTDGTIQGQLEMLRAMAAQNNLQVVAEAIDDGVSGTVPPPERSGGAKLVALIQRGAVDVVLVRDLDRISRDPDGIALPLFRKALRDAGVSLWTRNGEVKDDTPESQLMQSIMGSLASYERLKIRQRTHEGRTRSIRNGGRPRGGSLIGYDWDKDNSQFIVHEEQAALVREVFRLAAEEGMCPFPISRNLKARGIRGGRKTYVSDTTVALMLRRECFVTGRYHPEPDSMPDLVHEVPPLIDRTTWELAQGTLEGSRRKAPSRPTKYAFLLRSVAVCSHCGRKLRAQHTGGRYAYYRCRGGIAPPLNQPRCAARKGIRADHVDEAVWERVVSLLTEPGALDAEVTRIIEAEGASSDDLRDEVTDLQGQLRELDLKLERLVDAVMDGLLPGDAVRARREAIEESRQPIERRLEAAQAKLKRATGNAVRLAVVDERLEAIRNALPTLPKEQRPDIVREFLGAVHIDTMTRDIEIEALVLFDDGGDTPGGSGDGSGGSTQSEDDGQQSDESPTGSDFYGNRCSASIVKVPDGGSRPLHSGVLRPSQPSLSETRPSTEP